MAVQDTFQEKPGAVPIRDLGLTIAGTPLEPILARFDAEVQHAGIHRVRPHYYLSTEWGVPFNTVAIAIPFYLARPDLTAIHAERIGHIEGEGQADFLRYLRHEMGHVVNYAYRLYNQPEWIKHFGSITQPYEEEYHPEPFSRRFVHHLPGWYAQKHPDEDWAETFAVWLTPGSDWRADYADRPVALAKLIYCEEAVTALADREPVITTADLDEDVGDLPYTIDQFYGAQAAEMVEFPRGLDGALRAIFEDADRPENPTRKLAATLLRRLQGSLMSNIYRWTGHFPERTRLLLRHLADRAAELNLGYSEDHETAALVALTTLVTALAMNHVHRGTYLP